MKESIKKLKGIYAGRSVAVLGGGPSLADDIDRLPDGSLMISVNQHALQLVDAHYLVFCDEPRQEHQANLRREIIRYGTEKIGKKISPIEFWTDFLVDQPHWDAGFTGGFAAWVACYLGGDPVLLCGMDCYVGEQKHFLKNAHTHDHPAWHYPLENHLKAWRPALTKCPNSEVIRAVSGPLIEIFGEYDADS